MCFLAIQKVEYENVVYVTQAPYLRDNEYENTYIYTAMTLSQENIKKAQNMLIRLEKIGVGMEGGGDVEHQSGGFGYTDEKAKVDDKFYMPKDINTEDNCRRSGEKCKQEHKTKVTTRQTFGTGENPMLKI